MNYKISKYSYSTTSVSIHLVTFFFTTTYPITSIYLDNYLYLTGDDSIKLRLNPTHGENLNSHVEHNYQVDYSIDLSSPYIPYRFFEYSYHSNDYNYQYLLTKAGLSIYNYKTRNGRFQLELTMDRTVPGQIGIEYPLTNKFYPSQFDISSRSNYFRNSLSYNFNINTINPLFFFINNNVNKIGINLDSTSTYSKNNNRINLDNFDMYDMIETKNGRYFMVGQLTDTNSIHHIYRVLRNGKIARDFSPTYYDLSVNTPTRYVKVQQLEDDKLILLATTIDSLNIIVPFRKIKIANTFTQGYTGQQFPE